MLEHFPDGRFCRGVYFLVHWYHPFWLYYITGKGKMQYGKLYKIHKRNSCKTQKCSGMPILGVDISCYAVIK